MASTINADNGVVSGSAGVKTTADTSGVLALQSNGSTGLTLDTALNVGIGTSSPATPLHIFSSSQEQLRLGRSSTASSAYLTFYANNSSSAQVQYAGILGDVIASTAGSQSGALIFFTTNTGTSAERVRIDSSGNVGIGTSSPSQKLDATVSSSTEGSGLAVTNSLTGGYGSGVTFYSLRSDTSAKVAAGAVGMEGASSWNSNATTSSSMVFKTINANTLAERFRIGSAGQLGIGGATYGTSGQVLTSGGASAAPTWSTPSAGAMVFITSVTASNSSTVDVENAMTTYGMYVIIATGLNMSAAGYLQCQLKIGGSYQTTNNYYWVTNRGLSPASAGTGSGIDFIRFGEGNSLPNNTSYGMMLTMYLPNPSSSQYKTTSSVLSGFDANLTNVDFYNAVGGFRGSTSALTGVRFFCNNARTFNGVFRLYGIANS